MRGTIVTFYSYKGGTGRTMALANTACALAWALPTQERVLMVDWDLEAPGLHRFFPPRRRSGHESVQGLGLGSEPGLLDLLEDLARALPAAEPADDDQAERNARAALASLDVERYIGPTEYPQVQLLRAGSDGDGKYSSRVNSFAWEALYRRAPMIYRLLAEHLARRYRWVLVDSRTGVTDISGICTALLPDKLVVVFTPNRQSLSGVRELVARALKYRRGSDDGRALMVYPLPSRIEASLEEQRRDWRVGNAETGIVGFQPVFQELFRECYGLAQCDLTAYFDAVQIQQTPDCAYGEVISVRQDEGDRFSLARSYREFVKRLTASTAPWEALTAAPAINPAPLGDPFSPPALEQAIVPPPVPEPVTVGATAAHPSKRGARVFLSYASEDRARVARVADALSGKGFEVFWDRETLLAGQSWRNELESALDAADVVVVFWSQRSVTSSWVQDEAAEGQRRGVLLPVLLDDANPPLSFRSMQALSLTQLSDAQIAQLATLAERIAARRPGDSWSSPVASASISAPARRWPWMVATVAVMAALIVGGFWRLTTSSTSVATAPPVAVPPIVNSPVQATATVVVPNVNKLGSDVAKAELERAGLMVRMTETGLSEDRDLVPGVVVSQALAPGTVVAQGTTVRLEVATRTVTVPDLRRLSWPAATKALQAAGLQIELASTRSLPPSLNTAVVLQSLPPAGQAVALGSVVQVRLVEARLATVDKLPKASK
jgi:MinD-like ATPase involved in chromosome partitioning or flagellar assembly